MVFLGVISRIFFRGAMVKWCTNYSDNNFQNSVYTHTHRSAIALKQPAEYCVSPPHTAKTSLIYAPASNCQIFN